MIYGNGILVALSDYAIHTSSDGRAWTETFLSHDVGALITDFSLAFGNGTFVAAAAGYCGKNFDFCSTIATSSDGLTWTEEKISGFFHGIAFGNGRFVKLEGSFDRDSIYTSSDGISWTPTWSAGPSEYFSSVAFGNGTFVAVGTSGTVITSSDGVTWTPRISGTSLQLNKLSYINGIFIAIAYDLRVQNSSEILISADGISWKVSTPGVPGIIAEVAYGNATYVAVRNYNAIYTSHDGVIWNKGMEIHGGVHVTYARGTFILAGEKGTILTSVDGDTWTSRFSGTTNSFDYVAFFDNTFILFGPNTILQSDPLPPYVPGITANGSMGPVSLKSSDTLSLRVSLGADEGFGPNADWWVAADTPMGWYYYLHPIGWYYAPLLAEIRPGYQGPLYNLPSFEVLNITGLPAGAYTFYFAVDTRRNGVIDYNRLSVESVRVTIQQSP